MNIGRHSATALVILLTNILVNITVDAGQTCATCTGVVGGASCHTHTACNDNEVCHMFVYTTELGQVLHDYSCAVAQACHHSVDSVLVGRSSNSVHHIICSVCCNDTSTCNEKLSCHTSGSTPSSLPIDCSDLNSPTNKNGTYTIYPYGTPQAPVSAYCEFDAANNSWTVIQRRFNGSVNFYRNWQSYKDGFGSPFGEYWIGNDIIHQLTSHAHTSLRIVMSDFEGATKYAQYSTFEVGDERSGYRLFVNGYTGTAGDALVYHSGNKFSTFDRDNDRSNRNCAQAFDGAWWFYDCHNSDLNGLYLAGHHDSADNGVNWYNWRGWHYSLKATTMMIRIN